ncbi:lipid phosphate phosphatase 2-like isoform X2 [Diospyros lotus]|uniref:lipid phosphate phosphatase 2-like isoform X2 n=1 Tax=Diospyros lotus TaxID=55363 RepID=UPI00225457B5|nr:lipid phosphate phosphatase 2-like isoform X2 [Diospyros lotus]XP_052200051.1 lipid phosphate phosphatase 2-like isoform X2 [Diospyros lotus]
MPDNQLGVYTIRSHGAHLARIHVRDWLILLLLVVIEVILNVIEPFHRFVGEGMLTDLKYPLKDNTVPLWAVPVIAVVLPFTVILVYYFVRKDVYDFHHAILGLLFSVFITGVITDAVKDAVGRPRPDFFWRCFPDGKGVFENVTRNVMCTGQKSVIKEGHKSFPSGHTSWSFAGLGFLSWYLSGKMRAFDHRGHVANLCIVVLPLLFAALVGVSRVDDYWHHWQDVFAGGLLGLTVASFCYLQFFPPPYDVDGWGPRAYFQMLAESGNVNQSSSNSTNFLMLHPTQPGNLYSQSREGATISEVNSRDTNIMLNEIESGRRH